MEEYSCVRIDYFRILNKSIYSECGAEEKLLQVIVMKLEVNLEIVIVELWF